MSDAVVATVVDSDGADGGAPASNPDHRAGRIRRWLPSVGSVGLGSVLVALHASFYGGWIVDDAGVTFSYARNVAAGHGLVDQAGGKAVEAYSDPTWLAALVFGHWTGLFDRGRLLGVPDYVLYPKALGMLCCVGVLVLVYATARALTRRAWLLTGITGVLLACVPSYVIWCFSGLENSLYALVWTAAGALLTIAVVRDQTQRRWVAVWAGVLALAAALTRPDGVVLAVAYPLVLLLVARERGPRRALSVRRAVESLLVFAVPFVAFLLWRRAEFGMWLPNTAVAKGQSLPSPHDWEKVRQLSHYAGWPAVFLSVAVVGFALPRRPAMRRPIVGLLVPLLLAVGCYTVLDKDWMAQYRFATPIWPLGLLLVVYATGKLYRTLSFRPRVAVAVLAAFATLWSLVSFGVQARDFRRDPTISLCFVADRYGRMLNQAADLLHLPAGSTEVSADLGGASLTSRLRLVDLAGLADTTIARDYANNDMPALRDYLFGRVRPAFLVALESWAVDAGIPTDPRLARDYHLLVADSAGGGIYVRDSVVPNAATLAKLRAFVVSQSNRVTGLRASDPLRTCGGTLRVGQTLTG